MTETDCLRVRGGTWYYYHHQNGPWLVWAFVSDEHQRNRCGLIDVGLTTTVRCEIYIWLDLRPSFKATNGNWHAHDDDGVFHKIDGRIHPLTLEQLEPVRAIKRLLAGENHPQHVSMTEVEEK